MESPRREAAEFETLISGTAGVGGLYDAWSRLRATLHGSRFVAGHAARTAVEVPPQSLNNRGPTLPS